MSKEVPVIEATPRERMGTRYTKRLRAAGKLPAIIYGHGSVPTAVTVDGKSVVSALKRGLHVFELKRAGTANETCLVKDLQFGWLGDDVIHVDFTRVNLDEVVTVSVALHFIGTPEAAKKVGSVLTHDIAELQVRCKVRDIPESIRIDLSGLTNDIMTVAELKLPPELTAMSNPHTALARIVVVLEEAAGEAVTTTATTEPEVLTAKKEEGAVGAPGDDKKKAAPTEEKKK
ncbi:MAG: 50S ribosomal protein L25 [Phycisphaerales bacterium]|nr:50S ribosomal protein L25 [Phycisphaerales bacterium]